jgi:hypothetical protein
MFAGITKNHFACQNILQHININSTPTCHKTNARNSQRTLDTTKKVEISLISAAVINPYEIGSIALPSLLDLVALDFAQRARNSNAARQVRARNLLHEPESADFVLPVGDVYIKKKNASVSKHPPSTNNL